MRLASSITPVLAGISTLYSTTNNIVVLSFTPSSLSNNVVSRRRTIDNKLYSSNTKNEIIDGSHQLLTVHDELDTISSTADTQSTQQNVVDNKKMNRRQLLKQCTISSLLGIVQLSGFCNEARAEVETVKDTDVDASTLPKEATTELTKSTTDSVESGKSDEIKPAESATEVKSEIAAPAESSTTSTKVEVVDKQETNKKENSEEYKAMKSIVDTYNSNKSSGNSKSKVAVGSTPPPTTATPSDALTSVISKDLSGFILPATLLAGSATIASSILSNNTDEVNGEKSILSTSVKDQANEMTSKNIQKRSEWKMDTPTPYGLQDGSPKQLVPPKGSDWERIDGGSVAGNGVGGSSSASGAIVEEKKPIEPSLKGSMPKPTDKVKAQKSISMAKLVKEGTTKQQKKKQDEWKGIDKPTPYGLKSDTPKYTSPNESSESVNFGEKALAAVSASKTTTTTQPLKGSTTSSSSSGNISMSNIVKGTEDPTQVKQKKVLTLDNKGRKVWKLESASSWIQTLATGGNSSKQKGKDWKGLPPSLSNKGGDSATAASSGKGGTNKEEALLSVAEKKAAMKKDVQRSISGSASSSSPPPVSKVKATKSISMAKIVKGAATSPPPAQQQSMFNSLPTKGSSAKAPVKKSFAKTTLKGAMKAAQSAIDSGTSSSQQTPVAKSSTSSGGGNGPVQALPTPSYSTKSNIMGGSSDNVVPVKKSFAKGSFKMKSSTSVSDNKMAGSSTPPVSGGPGMGGGSSSSSSTAASMPSSSVTMKGSAPPSSPISGSSNDVPVKKSFSKSSFKKKSSGKLSPGGWAVSSSPIESSISASSAKPITPVAKQAAPVSLPPPPVTKGTESNSPNTQGLAKSPVSAVKKSYGKSSFKSSLSGGAGGMLKGSSSQLFGAGPTPKSSTSFGKSVTNKKKTFGKSISMANVMKQGSSGASGGGGDIGFLSGLEQSSIPSSSPSAASPDPSSNAAVLLPKQVSTSEPPPPQVPKVETPQVTAPKMEADQASNQVRQPPPQMPPPLGQIGNSEASGVRIGSANRFGNTPPATFAAPVNRGQRQQQQQQQQAQTSAVAEKENKPRQAAQSIKNEVTQSAAPAVTTVTITDPRTGKKRTITTSSNIRP